MHGIVHNNINVYPLEEKCDLILSIQYQGVGAGGRCAPSRMERKAFLSVAFYNYYVYCVYEWWLFSGGQPALVGGRRSPPPSKRNRDNIVCFLQSASIHAAL